MKIEMKGPFFIGSRLLPAVRIGGDMVVSIEYGERSRDNRAAYIVHFDHCDGRSHTEETLFSGVGGGGLQRGMEAMMSFLGAAAESYRYAGMEGENSNLFPEWITEWAYLNENEIASLGLELAESEGLLEEVL